MPDYSDAGWAYNNAGWSWWQIANVLDWNWWYDADCIISHGNGRNETALVDRVDINGNAGYTVTRFDNSCVWWFETQHIIESDIMVANDLDYAPQDESFWNWSEHAEGRVALVHEWGHAIGLSIGASHSDGFAVMRVGPPLPLAGGNSAEPYPDDAAGARFLYPGSYSVNLFASAQQLLNGEIRPTETNSNTTRYACPGGKLWVNVTVGNNGASNVTGTGFRIYLNNGPNKYSGGWNMWSGTATSPASSQFTQNILTTVPNVAPGLYWVLWQIDTSNAVNEFNEADNAVHSMMTVQVLNCGG